MLLTELGIIAGCSSAQQVVQQWHFCGSALGTIGNEPPGGAVSLSTDGDHLLARDDFPCRHGTDGQGTRLIATDDLGAAECLDGRQAPHQGMAPRHPLDAESQGDDHHRGKPFGDGGDRQADRTQEELKRRYSAQQAQSKDQRHDAQTRPQETSGNLVEPTLQRRGIAPGRLEERGDMADLRVHTTRHGQGAARTARNVRAEEDHIVTLRQRCLGWTNASLFLNRL